MQVKRKKFIAMLCAAAVMTTSAGGLPIGGFKLFDTAVKAIATSPDPTEVGDVVYAPDLYVLGNGSTNAGSWVNGENWNAGASANKMS